MICKKLQALLTLLFVGSASMLAEGYDPFPEVNYHQWQGNMSLYARVILDGVELDENTIVAVYDNEQIRGKEWIGTNKALSMVIGGDSGEYPSLHFKVYTGGRIIEVDQGLTYQYYAKIGSFEAPYIIYLPTPVVTNTSNEGWATTCLPFNAAVPEGVTVYTASRIENGSLKIEPVNCTILPKNTPVLLKTENMTSYEWLSRVTEGDAEIENNLFKGTTEAKTVEPNTVLTLGHSTESNHEIGFWLFSGTTVPANRAYLETDNNADYGVTINWDDESNGIKEIENGRWKTDNAVYDLQGRRIESSIFRSDLSTGSSNNIQSSIKKKVGLVIVNGKKIVVK